MSDFEDEDERDEDDGSEIEDGPPTLACFAFTLTGMECLNVECIRAVSFIRNREGTILDIRYALTENTLDMLSAPFERFDSDEAYLTLSNDDAERVTTLLLHELDLKHMELEADEEDTTDMVVLLSFDVKRFEQKLLKGK